MVRYGVEVSSVAYWNPATGTGISPDRIAGDRRQEGPAVELLASLASRCLSVTGLGGPEVGLVVAVGSAIRETCRNHARTVLAGDPRSVSAREFLYTTPNAVTARAAILLGLPGETLTLPDPATPFWAAADLLRDRRCVAVLSGGIAPSPEGVAGALCCLELRGACGARGTSPVGGLRLWPPAGPADGFPAHEASVALAAASALAERRPTLISCGRRGVLSVEPVGRPRRRESAP